MRIFLITGFILFLFHTSRAQQFGGNPPSVKWKQVNTDTVRIIFPEGYDSTALHIANYIHSIPYEQKQYSNSIGSSIKKINLVLQPGTTISNAYVGLGPWRSEFYLMPSQNAFELSAQNWAYTLSIHEWRHVQQFSNFNTGLSHTMKFLFGEYGQSLANAAAVPDWFFEGDAVYNETLLSEQGRGRLPFFFNDYKSILLSDKKYSYMQLRNGSYKNFIPDHYKLGYLLVSYGREKYGNDFWKNVTHDAAAYHSLVYPFQHAIKKYAGIPFNVFENNALTYYADEWKKSADKNNGLHWVTPVQEHQVINYQQPYKQDDNTVVVLKSGNKMVSSFYTIGNDGTEKKIAVKDISIDDYYSYNNGRIVYAAYQPDARWSNRDYSVIKLLDVETGKEKTISKHTKYFSPDIAHDGKMVITVEMQDNTHSNLVLMDAGGTIISSWKNTNGIIYSQPKFSADDKDIYVITRNDKGDMGMEKRNISNGLSTVILPMTNAIIGYPAVQDNAIVYSRTANGNDEIWEYLFDKGEEQHLVSAATGLYQGVKEKDSVLATVFTSDGYRLAKIATDVYPLQDGPALKPLREDTYKENAATQAAVSYPISSYKKATHLFNFHSWAPSFDPPDYTLAIYGENVLNTLQSQLYYQYNSDERFNRVGYAGIYGAWYLQPFIDISETFNRRANLNADTAIQFNEGKVSVGLQLPLNFSQGKFFTGFSASTSYNYSNVQYKGIGKELFRNSGINYAETRIAFSSQIQKAVQHIYPHFGYSIYLQSRNALATFTANQVLASVNLYLPGFSRNHSIVVNAAYQARDTANQYYYSDNFPFSRGYEAFDFPRLWKLGINYHLPVCYPDWGFGNIVFFNRIRLNAFFDNTMGRSLRQQTNYIFNTAGGEIYFDTKWWNQQPLTFGIRYSHLLNESYTGLLPNQWEFILPVISLN